MSKSGTVTVALPVEFVSKLRGSLEGSATLSDTEVIFDALRDWQDSRSGSGEKIQWLRQAWAEAKQQNGPYYPAEDVFDRLRSRYQKMLHEEPSGQ